jgi:excisionase family DNA binding protein
VAQGGEAAGLLTVREVAATLRVSTMTVYRLIKAGDLRSTRVGKGYRIRSVDLERYLGDALAGPEPGPSRAQRGPERV